MADQHKQLYDLCVVGAGMIGSAAARHASLRNIKLCLIGPSESQVGYARKHYSLIQYSVYSGSTLQTVGLRHRLLEWASVRMYAEASLITWRSHQVATIPG